MIFCQQMDSNRGPLESEATALPNEPQPYCMLNTFFFIQFFAINKFRAFDDDNDDKVNTNDLTSSSRVFEDSFETLLFEMNHIMKNSTIGFNLKTALCFTYLAEDQESIPLTLFAVQLRLVLVPNIVHQNGQFKYLKFCIKYCFSGFRGIPRLVLVPNIGYKNGQFVYSLST